jgi:hypothetical protein
MRDSYSSLNSAGSRGGIFTSVSSSFATSTSTAPSSFNSSLSFSRRRALKDADSANQVRIVDSYPLSKYMTIAQRLFGYFEQAYESLHLDEAYVYGMRFAQLALTNLPKHREWTAGGVVEENLKSQVAKVLSRLEIIKWRMDKEESMKLRTRMLAQAEEEVRLQNQFNREQEQRNNVTSADEDVNKHVSTEEMKVAKSAGKKSKGSLRKFLRMPKRAESVAAKSNNDIENSSLSSLSSRGSISSQYVSQPIIPSLCAIKLSRAHYEQQHVKSNINRNAFVRTTSPVLAEPNPTRYTIEQYPIVNEVTLKLQSTQTSSLLNLQSDYHHTAYGGTIIQQKSQIYRKEKEGVNEERELFNNSSSRVVESVQAPLPLLSSQQSPDNTTAIGISSPSSHTTESIRSDAYTTTIGTADISDEGIDMNSSNVNDATQKTSSDEGSGEGVEEVLSSSSSEIVNTKDRVLTGITHQLLSTHREKDLNLYELVLEEMRDKISCIYIGHHDIFEPSYKNDDEDRTTENDKNVHSLPPAATEDTEEKSVENENIEVHPWTDKDPVSAPSKSPKNKDIFNSFDAFDDFLSNAFDDQIDDDDDEESYMEFTVIEEEYTVAEEIDEIKEDLEEEESYTEYTVVEEGVESSDFEKIEEAKTSDDLTGSPRCVTSDKMELLNDKNLGSKFPTMSIDVPPAIIDDDNMTYITVDPWLEELDDNSSNHRYQTEPNTLVSSTSASRNSSAKSKHRIKAIIHKSLWKRDPSIVVAAIEELHELVSNDCASTYSRAYVVECGGVMAIIRSMIGFPDNEGIQFLCCTILGQLALQSEARSMIIDMDAIPLIAQSMTDHSGSHRIQEVARASIATVYS